jgi:eukaryotic-like serine/threonine-protein kinase
MAMEFIEGQNLREFLRNRKKLEPMEATRLAADVCRGLDYAFKRGISHRDLKTSNVLVASVGQAKLVDFGLAGADPDLSDEALANIENPRTIDYAALERATGVRKDDARSDIYFLGAIFYNMLAGVPPLQETRDRIQRLSKTRFTSVTPLGELLPDLPKTIVKVVGKAMDLEPGARYQTPAEFLADLELLLVRLKESGNGSTAADLDAAPVFKQRTVMVVESSTPWQDKFRELFKNSGFRVLVTSDPQRFSFTDVQRPADCLVFSTSGLGEEALEWFNSFGYDPATSDIPSILLLGAKHHEWKSRAKTAKHRVTVSTPIKLRELRELMDELVPREMVKTSVDH